MNAAPLFLLHFFFLTYRFRFGGFRFFLFPVQCKMQKYKERACKMQPSFVYPIIP